MDSIENDNIKTYFLTPGNLIENLNLIIEEPIIFELLKPLTVQSLLINCHELTDFISKNFADLQGEISLVNFHNNSIFLSKLLIIITINLIIVEILIKLKKQNFKDFIKYPRKYILFRNFKNFKNLCHFKSIEIFTLVEKNFIVPPVIPMNNATNINLNQVNQYQIYYNLSLSCLNLCNYYHTLNLTNTLNTENLKNQDNVVDTNYGNEAQEHQKIINLNKAITYYQLINIKSNDPSIIIQLYELFEILFTYERYYFIYSSNNYCSSLIRNNDLNIQLNSNKINKQKSINVDNKFQSNVLYDILNVINEFDEVDGQLFRKLVRHTNFNVGYKVPEDGSPSSYFAIKSQLLMILNQDNILEIIKQILLFKLLLVEPIPKRQTKLELQQILKNLNVNLTNDSGLFKLQISNYQSVPHLLHLLKVVLENGEIDAGLNDMLVEFSDHLIKHFPFFNNINKLIRAHKTLNDWFLNLNSRRSKVKKNGDAKNYNGSAADMLATAASTMPSMSTSLMPEQSYLSLLDDLDGSGQIHELPENLQAEVTNGFIPAKSTMPIIPEQHSSSVSSSDSVNEQPVNDIPSALSSTTPLPMAPPLDHSEPIPYNGHEYFPHKSNISIQQEDIEQMTMSESTKNLYNLFHQISEEFSNNHNNVTNIFQLNPQFLGNKDDETKELKWKEKKI